MKNIATKSIHKKENSKDGIRICVMRRVHPEYRFQIWIPEIAPSEELIEAYVIKKTMKWKEFIKLYTLQTLSKPSVKKILQLLVTIAQTEKITLLCTEESAKYCHRSLIIKECEKQKNAFKK